MFLELIYRILQHSTFILEPLSSPNDLTLGFSNTRLETSTIHYSTNRLPLFIQIYRYFMISKATSRGRSEIVMGMHAMWEKLNKLS